MWLFLLLLLSTSSVVVLQRICVALLCSPAPAPPGLRSPFHLHLPLRVLSLSLSLAYALSVCSVHNVCLHFLLFHIVVVVFLVAFVLLYSPPGRQTDSHICISSCSCISSSSSSCICLCISSCISPHPYPYLFPHCPCTCLAHHPLSNTDTSLVLVLACTDNHQIITALELIMATLMTLNRTELPESSTERQEEKESV